MPPAHPDAVRLLSLDGGGVKGISSMMILDDIMKRVRELEGHPADPEQHLPHKYFDLAGGTSTGGLAALMMFRLKLSTKKTSDHYDNMSKQIFRPKIGLLDLHSFRNIGYFVGNGVLKMKKLLGFSGYAAAPLERAIDFVVKDSQIPAGGKAPLLDDTKPKM